MTVAPVHSGFGDSVRDSQAIFRSVMMALARPGSIQTLATALAPPLPLTRELAAVGLALADHETTIWLDADLAASPEVADFLRFHTGARQVADPSTAAFAMVSNPGTMPKLADFARGTDEYPDRSTTIVIAVDQISANRGWVLNGPGIKGTTGLAVDSTPVNFVGQLMENHAIFPRGIDCLFVAAGVVAALPRSTRVAEG